MLNFYKKFTKIPKLGASEFETTEEESDLNEVMQRFVSNYLLTAQLVYDLVPLMAVLGDDPYLESFEPGRNLYARYFRMANRVHIELIRRANLQRMSSHLPSYSGMAYVRLRRIKASNFKL